METLVIVVLVIAVAWFALSRVLSRRRAQDDTDIGGWGMMPWLPAWMLLGGPAGHAADRSADAHATGQVGDWGGGAGGDPGSGFVGDGFGGGGDGGGFGGN